MSGINNQPDKKIIRPGLLLLNSPKLKVQRFRIDNPNSIPPYLFTKLIIGVPQSLSFMSFSL